MIDHLIPDIPRLYSAIAEWLACMIFILPFKKEIFKNKDRCDHGGDACCTERIHGRDRRCQIVFLDSLHDGSCIPYAVFSFMHPARLK